MNETPDSAADALYRIRHSLAHVMAQAVLEMREGSTLGFGPPVADGFYYDFILSEPLTEKDFPKIEQHMRRILKKGQRFYREDVPVEEGYRRLDEMGEPYKREYAQHLVETKALDRLTFYRNGPFLDMCDGPHVDVATAIPGDAFRLRSVAGAYWRSEPTRCAQALPWLRSTRTSEDGATVTPDTCHPAQALFGMPRRLRLVVEGERVVGVVQKKHGSRYQGWEHPLTPHFRTREGMHPRPVPMRPGTLSYRNWLGVTLGGGTGRTQRAATVRRMQDMAGAPACEILAGGWAMRGMKALDFHIDTYPNLQMDAQAAVRIRTLVEAATMAGARLARALRNAHGSDADTASVEEAFVQRTESAFIACAHAIARARQAPAEKEWIETLRRAALRLFDGESLPKLSLHSGPRIERITSERRSLRLAFTANAAISGHARGVVAVSGSHQSRTGTGVVEPSNTHLSHSQSGELGETAPMAALRGHAMHRHLDGYRTRAARLREERAPARRTPECNATTSRCRSARP